MIYLIKYTYLRYDRKSQLSNKWILQWKIAIVVTPRAACLFLIEIHVTIAINFVLRYESFVDRAVLNTVFVEWDFIHVVWNLSYDQQ